MPELRPGEVERALDEARARHQLRDWTGAREAYTQVRSRRDLAADDHYALANCSWWLGELDVAIPEYQETYRRYLEEGNRRSAALVALEIGYTSALRGEQAQASGWIGRAYRDLEGEGECAERGYLTYLEFEEALGQGELDTAVEIAHAIDELGRRFRDPTLSALGVLGQGRAAVVAGDVQRGMALLDEAMVAAVSDELEPSWAGNIYCNMMMTCWELADWSRASEWTDVTARWCQSLPGAGPFMGICRVHRAQVLHVRGDWSTAEREARHACTELADFIPAMAGEGWYALGDLQRQRGLLDEAEESYRTAHRHGRDPCPGLSLLRLAQGRRTAASSGITRALERAAGSPLQRARLLPAAIEVSLACDDVQAAAAAADELAAIAGTYGTTGLVAMAETSLGAVALARGSFDAAIEHLERARQTCQRQCTPYDVARVRLLLAEAHRGAGHHDEAALEAEAAHAELDLLGAEAPVPPPRRQRPDGLSPREAEVLELLADGRSNQEIAAALVISVRTVERHLATIYQKLGVSGRSARTAAVRRALDASGGTA